VLLLTGGFHWPKLILFYFFVANINSTTNSKFWLVVVALNQMAAITVLGPISVARAKTWGHNCHPEEKKGCKAAQLIGGGI
jgi:hypothetical protein